MKTKAFSLLLLLNIALLSAATAASLPHSFTLKRRSIKSALITSVLNKIEYNFSSSAIRPAYLQKLDQLAIVLIQNKSALSLRGYADSIGNYTANWHLSEKRAIVVKAYLVKKGVDTNHVITTPFGSTKPIASNETPQGRQMNRRVEVRISDTE